MEKKLLWLFVVALLVVNLILLAQRKQGSERFQDLSRETAIDTFKAMYADEEEALVTAVGTVPTSFPLLQRDEVADDQVEIVLVASVDDCTNCIEDELAKLNRIAVEAAPQKIVGIQGFFVDEDKGEMARRFIEHLSPVPRFPMSVSDVLTHIPRATTPLVLIIRSRDGKILDAHKPIPEDLTKRDAFYTPWNAALGLK